MSNIYIQEPPTNGKVLLKTTVGEIEVELFSKEAPRTCKNFVQLCLDGFYNGTLFHRLVKSFIVQGGENSEPADLIEPIKNEFHQRLRFNRRGLVGMATNEGSDNNMQFFFTLDQTPELQNTHTIFGKITGETVYNMIKLNDSQTDHHERPLFPHKINKVKILHNPYADITARHDRSKSSKDDNKDKKSKKEGVKNFKLISFGDEAEQDEIEVIKTTKKPDPPVASASSSKSSSMSSSTSKKDKEQESKRSETPPLPTAIKSTSKKSKKKNEPAEDDSDSDYELWQEKEKMADLEKKKKEIQDEIKDIKKQYHKDKRDKNRVEEVEVKSTENEVIQGYLEEKEKYKLIKTSGQKKGSTREQATLKLLEQFKSRLQNAAEKRENEGELVNEANSDDENWLSHKLDFSSSADAVLAKDASKKADDWYDIYDPRNPINKRKRGGDGKEDLSVKRIK